MNVPRQMLAAVAANGWVYAIGGTGSYRSGPPVYASIERAQINPDGSLGSWQYTTSLNKERCDLAAIASNGWIYALGGTYRDPMNGYWYVLNSVERANINGDGSLSSWSYTSSMNELRYWPGVIVYNNWIYVLGGYNAPGGVPTNLASIERVSINPDGSLNAWQPLAQSLPQGMHAFSALENNGWLYIIGGRNNNTSFSSVYRAPINADGTFGAWITEPSLNISRDGFGAAIVNGKIYITGGITVTSSTNWDCVIPTESAVINSDNSLGSWCVETNITVGRDNDTAVSSDGRIYAIGGYNCDSPTVLNTTESALAQ